MDLRFVEMDELLDRVNARYFASSEDIQARWQFLLSSVWLYHELQLEGVAALPTDLERAFDGAEGADYCDRVLLDQIRRGRDLLAEIHQAGVADEPLSLARLSYWQREISGQEEAVFRHVEGATEQYKHETVPVSEVFAASESALSAVDANKGGQHPLRVAMDVLYDLGKAWPFMTWSGATARWTASYVLLSGGYPPLVIPARERLTFYQAYHYDPTRLEHLVLRCVEGQLRLQEQFLKGELDVQKMWGDGLSSP